MQLFRSGYALLVSCVLLSMLLGAGSALLGVCGPFTDVAGDAFCPFVLEIFTLGITTGTTPTTYDPAGNVSRLQMAAFLSRSVDGVLNRGSRRAALRQFWTSQGIGSLGVTTTSVTGSGTGLIECDGTDIWAPTTVSRVARVRGSDGKLLETWTGSGFGLLSAMNRIFLTHATSDLSQIDPTQAAGSSTVVATNLGGSAFGIAFDGGRIWTANLTPSSVSIVTPGATLPWTVTSVTRGSGLVGALYDGANIWVTDAVAGTLLKLDSAGGVLQTVTVGTTPQLPVFDGANIWVPNFNSSSVSVVRASNGAVLATLTGNGLGGPKQAAFDGQRVLVTNGVTATVSLWKAANLSTIGFFSTGPGSNPAGACSDGVSFWVGLNGANKIVRF